MASTTGAGRVLVLGGSGFLGAHLVAELAQRGEVVSASRRPAVATHERSPRESDVAIDLAQPGAAPRLLDLVRPERVALVAALARVGDCSADPDLARRLNGELPGELAAACSERGMRLVVVSTDLVFGREPPRAGTRYREEDPPSPAHVYGRTKAQGEALALAACTRALVVRLPLLYGPSAGRGLGASDGLLFDLDAGRTPTLFTDEWRTPLEVGNAALALVELLDGERAGILHVAGPERVSRLELARAVLAAHGRRDELRFGLRSDLGCLDRPADVSLDASRARAALATPLRGIQEGLAAAYAG